MSITIASSYAELDGIEYRTRRPIRASDWKAIARDQNLLYARRGERISGIEFFNPFTTTSASYTVINGNAASDGNLNEWNPVFTAKKRINYLTYNAAKFTLSAFGTYYDISWTVSEVATAAPVASGTLTNATATRQWSSTSITIPYENASNSDGTPKLLILEVQARRNTGANAEIHQIHLRSKVLTAGEIPADLNAWEHGPQPLRTFTPAGATGYLGPSQVDVDAAYAGTALEGEVTVLSPGYQLWTVPFTGNWKIRAYGAGFDGVANQRGADITGEFLLYRGDQLRIVVGHVGDNIRCGSGGSFVCKYDFGSAFTVGADSINVTPLIIAGGAGGTNTANNAATGGQAGNGGGNASTGTAGGVGGAGGGGVGFAVGGAGWNGNGGGADGAAPYNITQSFLNGAEGNLSADGTPGSFGGGGTGRATTNYRFGGGGGYSGGGAANTALATGYGGGGGSYNVGSNVTNTAASNIGDGKVEISWVDW